MIPYERKRTSKTPYTNARETSKTIPYERKRKKTNGPPTRTLKIWVWVKIPTNKIPTGHNPDKKIPSIKNPDNQKKLSLTNFTIKSTKPNPSPGAHPNPILGT